ncbi:MAG: nitroreductase family protein [Spirochaetales bacterium]|nr:nitroreductase family protein [Spirochaetales bacterium]
MDFFEAVKKRCSYRGTFMDKPVPREDLRKIVQAGLDAPSGRNKQTTDFIVVDDEAVVKKIQALPGGNRAFSGGKAYILCLVDKEKEAVYEGMHFQLEDCSAAVENILLAISALGYAAVWIDGWLRVQDRAEALAELTGVPVGKKVQIVIPLGIPAEDLVYVDKKSFEERVTFL